MGAALYLTVEFGAPFTCANCGVAMCLPLHLEQERRRDGKSLYCPNGHDLSFGKTEAQRLREQLEAKQRALEAANARATIAENSAKAHEGKLTELKNRIHNGVCPCCKRSFQNLRRHMATKHPDYKDGAPK